MEVTEEPLRCEGPGCENKAEGGRVIYECDECGANVCSDCSENFGPHGHGVRCVDGRHIREVVDSTPHHKQAPSPYCAPYLTRKQTEEIWRLLHQQPQKKWAPHRKALLKALKENANGIIYPETP